MTQGAAHFDLTEAKAPSVTRPSRCLSNSGPVGLHETVGLMYFIYLYWI